MNSHRRKYKALIHHMFFTHQYEYMLHNISMPISYPEVEARDETGLTQCYPITGPDKLHYYEGSNMSIETLCNVYSCQ